MLCDGIPQNKVALRVNDILNYTKNFFSRLLNLTIGLFLYALGIVITMKASVGFAPWEVFQAGIAKTIGLSIGLVSIFVGFIIIIAVKILGEQIGFGTILNMLLIGIFMDLIIYIDVIPKFGSIFYCLVQLIAGLFTISVGSYFYIKTAFGAGPRDSLMVALARRTRIPVGICRSLIELSVTFFGWLLGGMVGIGTVISVIGIGFCIQITFRIFRFNVTAVKHESFKDTFDGLRGNGATA